MKRIGKLSSVLAGVLAISAWVTTAIGDAALMDGSLGNPKLIQEIDCAKVDKELLFMEYPAGVSQVQKLLDTPCRVLPNSQGDAKYMAYRIGEGKGLKAGAAYVLNIEYPEDLSRAMYVGNWGCETALGFATGQAIGDVLKGKYVPNNPESLKYPLSGKMQTWSQFFYLHDRFPEIKRPRGLDTRPLVPADGFWVIIAQPAAYLDPMSAGAAVSTIRLYEVQDPAAMPMKLNLPPDGLPLRHVFSREEMADGVVASGHKPEEKSETLRGVKTMADWYEYKMRVMQFLGVNTFTTDLLEFGHNQGWDSADGGGDGWVYQSSTPNLWSEVLDRAAKLHMSVLPYYEYRGSVGGDKSLSLGNQHRCRRLDGGEVYTHIEFCENRNVDVVDPDTIADAKKVLDVSLVKYKDKVNFLGAWFRQRPTSMPLSFSDADMKMFSAEANDGTRITRSHLQGDKALLDKYYTWWFGKRKAFYDVMAAHLREKIGPDSFILYTNDSSEPGRPLPRTITGEGKPNGWEWMQVVVNDDMEAWGNTLGGNERYKFVKPYDIKEVVDNDIHLRGLQTFSEDWDKWMMSHSIPPDDPKSYVNDDGVMLSYTYNRLYTVGSPRPFDAYRNKTGLTLVRHYSLNENEMNVGNDEILGYFVCDVERAGPYCMMAEARAMAYGDPTNLGSLTANSNKRGFPGYVRQFNAAFLALPALPSEVVASAASDPEVVVRVIKTPKNGTYYSVVNTSFAAKKDVVITLPAGGKLKDAATGKYLLSADGKLTLNLYPAELRAIHNQ